MTIHDREFETYYGPLSFEDLMARIEQACRDELAAGERYGFGDEHRVMFEAHRENAGAARAIYNTAMETARQVAEQAIAQQMLVAAERLHAAGLDDFARVIETGETNHVIF